MTRALSAAAVDRIIALTSDGQTRFDVDRVGTIYPTVWPDHIMAYVSGLPRAIRIDCDTAGFIDPSDFVARHEANVRRIAADS